ncbi:MAG TPA: hypothetical protein VKT21_06055, partial [Thermoplasmata archaeon]|nr:hypothetical protein [Thermoplasmata archaeon]
MTDQKFPFTVRYPKAILAGWAVLMMAMMFAMYRKFVGPEGLYGFIDPTFKNMIMSNDPDRGPNEEQKNIFGDDEFVVIAVENESGVFNPETLARIDRISQAILAVPGVREVYSLTHIPDIRGHAGVLDIRDLITRVPTTPQEAAQVEKDAFSNPTYVRSIVSDDKKVAGINVEIARDHSRVDQQGAIIASVYEILEKEGYPRRHGIKGILEEVVGIALPTQPGPDIIHVTGFPVASYTGGTYMLIDMVIFSSICMVALFAAALFIFRRLIPVIASMMTGMLAVCTAYGTMAIFGT